MNFDVINEFKLDSSLPPLSGVGLLEADSFLRRGWSSVLREAGVAVVGEWSTPEEADAHLLLQTANPGTVIVGLRANPDAELRLIARSVKQNRGVHFLCVGHSAGGEALTWAVLRAGARALAHRDDLTPRGITTLLQAVAAGFRVLPGPAPAHPETAHLAPPPGTPVGYSLLSPQEREVLANLCHGFDNLKLAAVLDISERTVKAHVSNLYRKLNCENRGQLIILARDAGLHLGSAEHPNAKPAPLPVHPSVDEG